MHGRTPHSSTSPWFCLIFALVILCGCGEKVEVPVGYSVSNKTPHDVSEPALPTKDLFQELLKNNEHQQLLESLTKQLDRLKNFVRTYARNGSQTANTSRPTWISDSFTAKGINRDKFAPRFKDQATTIDRWQTNPQAPSFSGEKAFSDFIDDNFSLWSNSSDFRLELKPYATKWNENQLETRVVAETYGQTDEDTGKQATALWVTRWNVDQDRKNLKLVSIEIKAQEQIALDAPQGELFHDCTESILAPTTLMKDQLIYGLDQWARKIPGINVVGDQGVAVGDINNDGLEDLYVCQAHGLPNLLLLQNPDGSVRDASKELGVDILDESHGALIVDLDNDGDQDLAISTAYSLVLMSQKGDGNFQLEHELTIGHNGQSLSAVDYDQDGDLDLFICKHRSVKVIDDLVTTPESFHDAKTGGRNVLLRNDEGWNFQDVTNQSGFSATENNRYSRSAVWTDYDLDGDQDLYIANEWAADQLYQNESGWFTEVGNRLKMTSAAQHRSVSTGEFNLDGKPDFFVANDSPLSARQRLPQSEDNFQKGSSKALDRDAVLGENQIWYSKGVDAKATENRAGFNSFFLRAPIFSAESSYGSAAADINNDGLDDVIVTNGHLSRYSSDDIGGLFYANLFDPKIDLRSRTTDDVIVKGPIENDMLRLVRSGISIFGGQRNRCYLSIGNLGFANFSSVAGLDFLEDARAVATSDWDNDGDVDVITTSRNGPQLRILSNQNRSPNGFLHFRLVGTTSNRDAIGARVELYLSGRPAPLVKFVTAGSGNLSQSSKRLFFGLGDGKEIEKAIVTWPDGKSQTFTELVANTRYTITEGIDKLAETNNERFELVLKKSVVDGKITLPPSDQTRFTPESWLPNIEYMASNKKWYSVRPVKESFTAVLFCDDSPESKQALARFNETKLDYKAKNLDGVVVYIDRAGGSDKDRLQRAEEFFEQNATPFRWGIAAESSIQKLEYYAGVWFSNQQLPQLPFAVVMTPFGQLSSFHFLDGKTEGEIAKRVDELTQTITELKDNVGIRVANDRGRWLNRYRAADFSRLVQPFREDDLGRTADELFFRSRPHMGLQLAQFASELQAEGRVEEAMDFYLRAVDLFPRNVPALVGLGELLRARAATRTAEELELKITDLIEARDSFSAALTVDPLSTTAIIGKTNVLIDENETTSAINELKAYLEIDPGRAEVHAILGRLFFAKRDYNSAARHLLAAYEMRPTLPYVAGDLGYLYLSSGEVKLGRQFLKLAHRLQPSDKNVVKHLAEAEFANENFSEAVRMLEKTIQLHPNHRRSKQLLAWLKATSPYEEDRDGSAGQKLLRPVMVTIGDRSPATLEIAAACSAESGDFAEAINFQEKAIGLVSGDTSEERYSEKQKSGLNARLELYKRKRPYRTAELSQIPIATTRTAR